MLPELIKDTDNSNDKGVDISGSHSNYKYLCMWLVKELIDN